MAKNVQFGLTLANRGVVIGVTTVEQMLQMSEIADSSSVYDLVWVGVALGRRRTDQKTQDGACLHGQHGT